MPALANFPSPEGDSSREAVEALGGYAYQIYESAIAWVTLGACAAEKSARRS